MNDVQSLIAAEHDRRAALVRGDAKTLAQQLTDSFQFVHVNGVVDDRDTFLDQFRFNRIRFTHASAESLKANISQGYAILSGVSKLHYELTDGSHSGRLDTQFLSVWEPSTIGWRIAAYIHTLRQM